MIFQILIFLWGKEELKISMIIIYSSSLPSHTSHVVIINQTTVPKQQFNLVTFLQLTSSMDASFMCSLLPAYSQLCCVSHLTESTCLTTIFMGHPTSSSLTSLPQFWMLFSFLLYSKNNAYLVANLPTCRSYHIPTQSFYLIPSISPLKVNVAACVCTWKGQSLTIINMYEMHHRIAIMWSNKKCPA